MLSPDPVSKIIGQPDDLMITCVDCGKDFTFSKGEQDFFRMKGLFSPKRCPACRVKKRQQKLREEASRNA